MLTNKGFIKWADDAVVVLISHNELGHDPIVEEKDGEKVERCPLYPGLTCRTHCDIAVETDNSRDDSLPVIPFVELCPNSWLILPDGTVERIPEEAQFTAKGIEDATAAQQKKLGTPLSRKAYEKVRPEVEAALAALEDEDWKKTLEALGRALAAARKPPASMQAWVDAQLEEVEDEVAYLFEEAREEEGATAQTAAVQALLAQIDVKVGDAYLPTRDAIQKWLAER